MKPTKNRVFCRECGRLKMLFENEKQALTFIKFNANNFDNKAPTRAYYCEACFGWHVTSRDGESYKNPMTENMIENYNQVKGINNLQGWYSPNVQGLFLSLKSQCMNIIRNKKIPLDTIDKSLEKILDLEQQLLILLQPKDIEVVKNLVNTTKSKIAEKKKK